MKTKILFLVTLLISFAAYAGQTGRPLQLREQRDMRFAEISPDPAGDIIALTPAGTISGVNASLFSGTPRAAEFRAKGRKNTAINISFSNGDALSGPGADMRIGRFTHDAGPTPQFPNNGQLRFKVGASMRISPGQLGGAYSGSYTVIVDYP